jgi:signal transduction histidine kinase
MLQEIASLQENIDHIKDIVTMQQAYATTAGFVEQVPLREIVEDAIRMNHSAFERHGVTLERRFRDDPMVTTDRHKVLQILVNILRNAKYACDEAGRTEKKITVELCVVENTAEVAITDNGVGIAPELLERIFAHGYTTRQGGHGFGLHSAALAAHDLGGNLTVRSEGIGLGATFTLRLHRTPATA